VMVRVNDTFEAGQERLHALLVANSAEPQGYMPQHHQAHVRWPKRRWRNGYPIRDDSSEGR
jgi:hypothetical protein